MATLLLSDASSLKPLAQKIICEQLYAVEQTKTKAT